MDLIKDAIEKAKTSPPPPRKDEAFGRPGGALPLAGGMPMPGAELRPSASTNWSPPLVAPNAAHLEKNRIVALATSDPSHVKFNLLRTKIFKTLTDNKWRTLAITSPTADCGKTMVAINLAFSLARQPNCRTVLIDLDLRKADIARTIGLQAKSSVGLYLQGKAAFEDCFIRVSDNLTLGLNTHIVKHSAELMHHPRLKELLQRVVQQLSPDVVLFDLPPMLAADDAMALGPNVDSYLLIAGAGTTTAKQIQECERNLQGHGGYLGVVLNKTTDRADKYYYNSA